MPSSSGSVSKVTSDIFIGREEQKQAFQGFIKFEPKTPHILNIHSRGDGGIGKTQLLLRMQDICVTLSKVIFTRGLIDFYHVEARSKIGLLTLIIKQLGVSDAFPWFAKLVEEYHHTQDTSERETIFSQIEPVFKQEYTIFANKKADHMIVLFFDTYEVLQPQSSAPETGQSEANRFLLWVETTLFPFLAQHANTGVVVAGRYRLEAINRSECAVQELELRNLSYAEALTFWMTCFGETSVTGLLSKIGVETEEQLKILYALAKGHPILLALVADWVQYAYTEKPFSIKDLCAKVSQKTGNLSEPVSQRQQEEFERELIEWVSSLIALEGKAITLMAIAYHRMTPEIFYCLTRELPAPPELKICERVLSETLQPLSFIKYKEGDIVLLHDEMRRLILQHYWKPQDGTRTFRKSVAGELLRYYDDQLLKQPDLSESERELYFSERLPYAFLARGLSEFCDEFDLALENGQYDYADLLLREAEKYAAENLEDFTPAEALSIRLRRIRESTQTDRDFQKAFDMSNAILEDGQYRKVLQENSLLHGHLLLERGIAEFYLGRFDQAVARLSESLKPFRQVFIETGDDYWVHWTNNWIGFAYYRQTKFSEAESYWQQSRRGFYHILVTRGRDLQGRGWRDLLQGLQFTHGNLSVLYNHTGQFEQAIQYGEMGLDIIRYLPDNKQELARCHNTLGYAFARAGNLVNAREHLVKAVELIKAIPSRLISGRVKTNLGFLAYRVNELAELLEFHRAEEIPNIIEQYVQLKQTQLDEAIMSVQDAITILAQEPVIKKELADAYYHLGWFHTISSAPNHWEDAEQALLEGLKWGKESKFQYRVVSIAESLVNLYYFWDQPEKLDSACREMERLYYEEKQRVRETARDEDRWPLKEQQQDEEGFSVDIRYPNLFGKYELVSGNIAFDRALKEFQKDFEDGMRDLKKAFTHYVNAAVLMQQFNDSQYYLALQVFYNRLRILIAKAQQREISIGVIEPERLDDLQAAVWGEQATQFKQFGAEERRKFSQILKYVRLSIQPQDKQTALEDLQDHSHRVFDKGNYAWALVLTDCLSEIYRALLAKEATNDAYRETLILWLERQAGLYREVREKYQATLYLQEAQREISKLSSRDLQETLTSFLRCRESTLLYRRGEYGRLLELHLQDELDEARRNFDSQFGAKARQHILQTFQHSEQQLKDSASAWKDQFKTTVHPEEKRQVEGYLKRFYDVKFRISEYLILEGRFDEALDYLKEIIDEAKDIGYTYREVNAMQRYLSALYFADRFDDDPKRMEYEDALTDKALFVTVKQKSYPSAVGRLRITQGNDQFSKCFYRQTDCVGESGYYPRKKQDASGIRAMLACYIEACDLMTQHSTTNFELAMHVLQRRIKQIADKDALDVIQQSLLTLWNEQEHLKNRDEERIILDQFTRLRSLIIKS